MAIGVICEFNPFHNGHKHLFDSIKAVSDKPIVCAMSGFFVQRGEPAFCPKEARAQWAVESGADLVLENPFPFSCATAEHFAKSAVSVLCASGICDELAFGAEQGNANDFFDLAEILLDKKTETGIKQLLKSEKNLGYAVAREMYITHKYPHAARLLCSPNSLLGVEYAKAILASNLKIGIIPVERKGASHDSTPVTSFASGRYLRENATAKLFENYCPKCVCEYFENHSPYVLDYEKYYAALSAKFAFAEDGQLEKCAELPWDYAKKIKKAVRDNSDFEGFFEQLKSKHITNAHLSRMLIYALTGVTREMMTQYPKSSNLLAFSSTGALILKKIKKNCEDFTVMSKVSDMKKLTETEHIRAEKAVIAENIYSRFAK